VSRTRSKTIGSLAAVLAVAALVPAAAIAEADASRAPTEFAQRTGPSSSLTHRTPSEISHQRALMQIPSVRRAVRRERERLISAVPASETGGFQWGDAAIGAGAMLAVTLGAFGGVALVRRRKHLIRKPSRSAVSS
jgi:hypothetical protein